MAKDIIFVTDENGCITPSSHKLNKDGYFRKSFPGGNKMYHRHVWEVTNGEIPEGFEINHKCKNRACCNIDHLECIDGQDHAILTNMERYSERHELARQQWVRGWTVKQLATVHNVTDSCVYYWIRKWKV